MPSDALPTTAPPATLEHDSRSQRPMVVFIMIACEEEPWRIGEGAHITPSTRRMGRGGDPITEYACIQP